MNERLEEIMISIVREYGETGTAGVSEIVEGLEIEDVWTISEAFGKIYSTVNHEAEVRS
jgi:hypothetical protein